MAGSLQANVDEIRSHAKHVDKVHGGAQTALDAAHQITPGGFDIAYGLICQFFPPLLHPIEQKAVGAIEAAATRLQATVDGLNASADDYQRAEEQIEQSLKEILEQLGQLQHTNCGTGGQPVDPGTAPNQPGDPGSAPDSAWPTEDTDRPLPA